MATRAAVRVERNTGAPGSGVGVHPEDTQLPALLPVGRDELTFLAGADWRILATLPHRLMASWLETHLRLVETTFKLAEQQLRQAELALTEALDYCHAAAETSDAAEQLHLFLTHRGRIIEQAMAGAHECYELIAHQQLSAFDTVARRATDILSDLQAGVQIAGDGRSATEPPVARRQQ